MGAALRPSQLPPAPRAKHLTPRPPDSEPSQPKECRRVKAGDRIAVRILNEVIASRREEGSAIAEHLGCPEPVLRLVRSNDRRKPFKVGHILAMRKHLKVAVLQALLVEALTGPEIPSADLIPHEE